VTLLAELCRPQIHHSDDYSKQNVEFAQADVAPASAGGLSSEAIAG